jgi:nitrogen fixation/metabolism regulation signal transduction histidine kinase
MGVGLILTLQIIEAHGGTLTLTNRNDAPGCRAEICLPIGSDVRPPTHPA